MVPPGRPKKGPHIHFQLRDEAQAELFRATFKGLGMNQADALCEAVDVWMDRKRRKRKATEAQQAAAKEGEGA